MSIKVVDYKSGRPCTRVQSVMRNIIFFIPFMPIVEFILVITDDEHRRAGDKWANTIVVKK